MNQQKIKRYNYLSSEISAIYHDTATRMGISDSALSILYAIYENGGRCLQSEIYKQTGSSRQTINSSIRKLEKEDIVYLEPGKGRNTIACLTKKGKAEAEKKVRPIMDAENEIFDQWTAEEVNVYLELTERYRDVLRQKLEVLFRE